MREASKDEVRAAVRAEYGRIAEQSASGGCCAPKPAAGGCCPSPDVSSKLGYSTEELAGVPEGANLGLGCGNPQAIAAIAEGETVLDLGSGAGFDCFLAAKKVGPEGRVIGVDMTPEMLSKARKNAASIGAANVEFRLGEIEHLPVADAEVDVILSNCVINLSPDKPAVFREAFRVLKPGGRLSISDVVASREIPEALANDVAALTGCVAGAAREGELESILVLAGFEDVRVTVDPRSREFIKDWLPGTGIEDMVASATVEARKPRGAARPGSGSGR